MLNREGAALPAAGGVPEHQQRVDELQAQVRREGRAKRPNLFKPAAPKPDPSQDPLDHRIAEELECIRRHLDLIGGVLVSEPILLHRYATQLQAIDRINQQLGHLARIVGSEQKEMAVDQVTMQDLRGRLQRRPLSLLTSPHR
jgi:hypothetical protein